MRTPWAFIGVDLHKAFGRDGGLRIDGAEELVPLFNDVAENGLGDEDGPPDEVLISYEEHVPGNLFLSKTHNIASGDTVVINGRTYKTWPWHGMTGTREVELFDGIDLTLIDAAFRKGYAFHEHPYSAFGGWLMVGSVQYPMCLEEYLKKKGIGRIKVGGLTFDYCAGETALEGAMKQFDVTMLKYLTRSYSKQTEEVMMKKLIAAGVKIIDK